eukprot:scaffold11490_cov67-Phaeocystis_antarctica.AAC.4
MRAAQRLLRLLGGLGCAPRVSERALGPQGSQAVVLLSNQLTVHDRAIARRDAVPRVPRALARDHTLDQRVRRLLQSELVTPGRMCRLQHKPRAVRARRRGQRQHVHPLRRQLGSPPAPVVEQGEVETARRRGRHRSGP